MAELLPFLGLIVTIVTNTVVFTDGSCIPSERDALLKFKQDLKDELNWLGSWSTQTDCCHWRGVICNNVTGHVTELHLRNPYFVSASSYTTYAEDLTRQRSKLQASKLNPSLLELKHLNYLDLSGNDFKQISIPSFIGSMKSLRYLNLSNAEFGGMISPQIGNLTNLRFLGLGGTVSGSLYSNNLKWLSGLSLLKTLDLSNVDLPNASDWFQEINKLVYLVELRLGLCYLPNPINPTLTAVNFSSLAVLDLSGNILDNSLLVPSGWIFSLKNLIFLDLRVNNFHGLVPIGLQNLTSLKHLDLSYNHFNSSIPHWLYSFSSGLEFLNLFGNEMHGNIPEGIQSLASLRILDLSGESNNFQVDGNNLIRYIGNLCNLRSIDLSYIKLNVNVRDLFQILSVCISNHLESLSLENCQLFGQLPNYAFGRFRNLGYLSLSENSISGNIPISFGSLSKLEIAYLSKNSMEGVVTQLHFVNLTRLMIFKADGNSLTLQVSPNWIPPFQLEELWLQSWHLGELLPFWVHSQKYLASLDMSNSTIVTIPSWFWNFSSQFVYLNLSGNQIHGKIPHLTVSQIRLYSPSRYGGATIDLSSNYFNGVLPLVSPDITTLDLSNNLFSGTISHFLCSQVNMEIPFNESMNMEFINRQLPKAGYVNMAYLNLGSNQLFGEIPNCWMKWDGLQAVELSSNNFIGKIPSSMGNLSWLQSLHLRHNNLSGEIPFCLSNFKRLASIDFGENQFDGKIPKWIGTKVSTLKILNLRSNKFHGPIPHEICYLKDLQILDLAHNKLSGSIPKCISNFSAMISANDSDDFMSYPIIPIIGHSALENAKLVIKGQLRDYNKILKWLRSVDISNNLLSGDIPMEVAGLVRLQALNLSNNFLTGKIPENIGDMRELESLDLSGNKLSDKIPQSISVLNYLSHLNLSYNKLIGKIPSSTQIDGLNVSSFIGNQLCGLPLNKTCHASWDHVLEGEGNGGGEYDDDDDDYKLRWSTMIYGFVVGFWCVVGPIMFSRKWRLAYFNFLSSLVQKFKRCFCL
ncbi:hypothetical protein JCGZ_05856 [Jatropha curcas]|uniref:Leucine-rich repeat-containing N-terminal plant-type domain-containing protein n=1 Tax=Jatropha curcas TaxID=180498 RepID=A0A067J8Q1_JATCU|nr:receptor-like protein EIX2 [Jatropha curcas]KDP20087.1 hypothetical protein JCGZ_05856 [Jatropha curcas]